MDTNGQIVSIGYGCEREGIVLHELMHTLGFFHTNSRPDRDAYVIVYTQNIKSGRFILLLVDSSSRSGVSIRLRFTETKAMNYPCPTISFPEMAFLLVRIKDSRQPSGLP